jgi:hypothetical protein
MTRRLHFGWWIYLAGYFALLAGAGLSLWRAGLPARLSFTWAMSIAALAAALGILLGAVSRR